MEDAFVRQSFGWIHLDLGFAVADVRPRLSKPNQFGVRREDDLALILAEESKFVIAADAIVGAVGYFRSHAAVSARSSWRLAQRYWFDALILVGLGVSIAVAVTDLDEPDAPNGPLWFDVAVTFAFFVPLLFRRRFPFGAPVVAAVAVAASTFVDDQRVPWDFTVFLLGMTIAFLFGALRELRQAIAGFAILLGVNAIVMRNDPDGSVGDLVWTCIIFGIAWTIGFGLGHKFREADEAKERADTTRASTRGGSARRSGRGACADRA